MIPSIRHHFSAASIQFSIVHRGDSFSVNATRPESASFDSRTVPSRIDQFPFLRSSVGSVLGYHCNRDAPNLDTSPRARPIDRREVFGWADACLRIIGSACL